MRTRLASLIIVKQEPISNDFNVDGENETVNYNNDLANHFYGQNRLENYNNGIGDLNNNNSKDEFEDHKSMYCVFFCFIIFIFFIIFISFYF